MLTDRCGNHPLRLLPNNLKTLFICSFLIPFGSFMALPFLPVILFNQGKLAMEMVGLILAVVMFIQFGGGIIGGIFADRIGLKQAMVVALAVRALGFLMLIFSFYSIYIAIPAMLLIATGSALYLPANKAYIIGYVSNQDRASSLAYLNSALNAGMAIGPLVGGLFVLNHSTLLFCIVFFVFVLVTLFHIYKIEEAKTIELEKQNYFAGIAVKKIIIPLLFNTAGFYIYFFFQNYMGPFVTQFHSPALYSFLLSTNCLLAFFYPTYVGKVDHTTKLRFITFSIIFFDGYCDGFNCTKYRNFIFFRNDTINIC